MPNFPNDWYWVKADGKAWSSARGKLVLASDAAFVAWKQTGELPTPWPKDKDGNQTDAALAEVLAGYGLDAPLQPLATVKAAAKQQIVAMLNSLTASVVDSYAKAISLSWGRQEDEARQIKAGKLTAAQAPMVSALATEAGMSIEAMTDAIIAKADAYTAIVKTIHGFQWQANAGIDAATTAAAVETAVTTVTTAATAKAKQMGLIP